MSSFYNSTNLTVDQINKIPFFKGLKETDKQELSSFLNIRRFEKDKCIITEGDPANAMYFILQGSVKIFKKSYENSDELVGCLSVNEYFGEMALIDGEKRSASVVAETGIIVAELEWESFNKNFSNKPDIIIYMLLNIIKTLSIRLRNVNSLYANIVPGFRSIADNTAII